MNYLAPTMPTDSHRIGVLHYERLVATPRPRFYIVGDRILFGDLIQRDYECERLGVGWQSIGSNDPRVRRIKAVLRRRRMSSEEKNFYCGG